MSREFLAEHLLLDYYGCQPEHLNDIALLEEWLIGAAEAAKTTVVNKLLHQFAPQGVSGVIVLAESHIAIHTWPELGYASIEIYVCGNKAQPEEGHRFLQDKFNPTRIKKQLIHRGKHLETPETERQMPRSSKGHRWSSKFRLWMEWARHRLTSIKSSTHAMLIRDEWDTLRGNTRNLDGRVVKQPTFAEWRRSNPEPQSVLDWYIRYGSWEMVKRIREQAIAWEHGEFDVETEVNLHLARKQAERLGLSLA